ncbi:MAG: NTP transferase domain-containing protein [Propionibacteriaceae bacterium]|jgi:hypothetical protein|nr:NTP transferase domain-containing protein [Propionibacteriaceae bacterium]
MVEAALVVLAGGMGSRYGGLKQIDPIGPDGEVILEYSVHDAVQAGFSEVVVVITKAMEHDFRAGVGARLERQVSVKYAYQELTDMPPGFTLPPGRVKPWGTGHAVLAARRLVDTPFSVINADDFYGAGSFAALAEFLRRPQAGDGMEHLAMVGYKIENTVTEHGSVARGVCQVDADGHLTSIVERTRIEQAPGGARYSEDDGATWTAIAAGTPVSMNLWGFPASFIETIEAGFPRFLDANLAADPLKCEYFLPTVVQDAITARSADVIVLPTDERWRGVTYREDKATVMDAIAAMHRDGVYPTPLWSRA